VQKSLMPKGVDHFILILAHNANLECKNL